MFISLSLWQMYFTNSSSLKDKRRLLNSLTDRLRRKLFVSCRIVSGSGEKKKAVLAVASIVESKLQAEKLTQEVEKEILYTPEIVLVGVKKGLLGSEVIENELEDRAFEPINKGRDWDDDRKRTC